MGNTENPQNEWKQKAIEELRSHSVGRLLHIIDELVGMDLSVLDIEYVLMNCRLSVDYAIRLGASIRVGKEAGHFHTDKPKHP